MEQTYLQIMIPIKGVKDGIQLIAEETLMTSKGRPKRKKSMTFEEYRETTLRHRRRRARWKKLIDNIFKK